MRRSEPTVTIFIHAILLYFLRLYPFSLMAYWTGLVSWAYFLLLTWAAIWAWINVHNNYHVCNYAANYTTNSTYQRNLITTLSALPSTNSGLGFFNSSSGQGTDRVNSAALCRGDINLDVCLSCLNDSIVTLQQLCPNQKEAIVYYTNCLMRYSNQTVLGNVNTPTGSTFYMFNRRNATDRDRFNRDLRPLLSELRAYAAAGGSLMKFASGNRTGPDFTTIYGLVQCTPDLSRLECSDCLEDALNLFGLSRYNGRVGGRTYKPTCNFRYEIYNFVNVSTLFIPPPPSSSPPAPPAPISVASPPLSALSPGISYF